MTRASLLAGFLTPTLTGCTAAPGGNGAAGRLGAHGQALSTRHRPGVMDKLAAPGVKASYFEIDTERGHVASGHEWAKGGPTLQRFVEARDR